MKILRYLAFILLVIIIQACSTKPAKQNTNSANASRIAFHSFLKKFRTLSLPLTIRTLAIVVDSSKKLDREDNKFIRSAYPDEIYAYGILADTTNNYKIIWLAPADVEVPMLTTFTKSGKKISEKELGVGVCGSDCGFTCKEIIDIKNDMTIFSVDSETYTNCDSTGKDGKAQKEIRYMNGKISNNGKIRFSKIIQRSIN